MEKKSPEEVLAELKSERQTIKTDSYNMSIGGSVRFSRIYNDKEF